MLTVCLRAGVSSVAVTGDGKDQLEVVGEGVDVVGLVKHLRKKIGHAEILMVEDLKPKKKEDKKPELLPYWFNYTDSVSNYRSLNFFLP